MPAVKDKYSNILQVSCETSAANTLTFQEIDVGLNLFDKIALLIHRLQFDPSGAYITEMTAETDSMTVGLCQSNQIPAINLNERAVVDSLQKELILVGTGANFVINEVPWETNYSDLPGGGILVAPKPLYLGIVTAGFAGVASVVLRMHFTILKLKDADYLELLESRRFFG